MPDRPPVAFSLLHPLTAAAAELARHPLRTLLPVALLLLPALPLLAGIDLLLREGGSAALQGWVAGSPPGTPHVLIERPDASGQRTLAGIAALLVLLLATVVSAALVAGATARADDGTARREAWRSLREWPALFVAISVQLLALGVVAAALVVTAVLAGQVRFQFGTVVLVLGFGALAVVALRMSLWPAVALGRGVSVRVAVRESWRLSRGSVIRLVGAAAVAGLLVIGPALLLRNAARAALTWLANAGLLDLAPLQVDAWALAPVPLGMLVLLACWGREAPRLVRALDDFDASARPGPDAAAESAASARAAQPASAG